MVRELSDAYVDRRSALLRGPATKRAKEYRTNLEVRFCGCWGYAESLRQAIRSDSRAEKNIVAAIDPKDLTEWMRSLRGAVAELEAARAELRAARRVA